MHEFFGTQILREPETNPKEGPFYPMLFRHATLNMFIFEGFNSFPLRPRRHSPHQALPLITTLIPPLEQKINGLNSEIASLQD